jgi:hypothetical protein
MKLHINHVNIRLEISKIYPIYNSLNDILFIIILIRNHDTIHYFYNCYQLKSLNCVEVIFLRFCLVLTI